MSSQLNISRVLVVDKSEAYRSIFSTAFAGNSAEVNFSASGGEALRMLDERPCSIVICSMFLDDMEGVDLCLRMRRLKGYAYTPFILATTADSAQAARSALPAGVTDIFNKANVNELIAFVRRFLQTQTDPMHGRIVLIEDNLSQRQMLAEIFRRWGLTVDAFETAEEAWTAFMANDYDLVVTDIVLTGVMSGLDFISRVRRQESIKGDVPILAITGFDDASRRIELFNLGVSDYVIKPIIGEELIARVRNLITHWHHKKAPR